MSNLALRHVLGCGDLEDHVGSCEFGAEVALHFDLIRDMCASSFVHNGYHAERLVDVLSDAVAHELELSIRWDERDRTILGKRGTKFEERLRGVTGMDIQAPMSVPGRTGPGVHIDGT